MRDAPGSTPRARGPRPATARSPSARSPSPGRWSARRRTRRSGSSPAPGRSPPAASRRRTAAPASCACSSPARAGRASRRPAAGRRRRRRPSPHFSTISSCCRAVRAGNRLYPWKMNPVCLRRNCSRSLAVIAHTSRSCAVVVGQHLPGVRFEQPRQHRQQRGLPAARRPHQQGELAGVQVERHVAAAPPAGPCRRRTSGPG